MLIGELAERTGASVRSIRYYERKGLITAFRRENGYREYTPFAEEQVRSVKLYLNLGLSTDQIAGFLHCVLSSREAFCEQVLPIYEQKLAEIDEQIRLLQRIKSNLQDRIASIAAEQASPIDPLKGE